MKLNLHSLRALILIASLSLLVTCKKDALPVQTTASQSITQGFVHYSWSTHENDFFSIARRAEFVADRSGGDGYFHPMLIAAYNEIAGQNEVHHFVDSIVMRVGLPHWSESFIYFNPANKENLVLIPLSYKAETKVSAFISVTRKNNESGRPFVINAISRQEVMDTTSGDPRQKEVYTKWMLKYDFWLFKTEETRLKETYCHYREVLDNPQFGPPPPPNPCEWTLIEVCWNTETNTSWIGESPINRLITGDYDGDGIPNSEDVDWDRMLDTYGDCDNDGTPNNLDPDWLTMFMTVGDHDFDCLPNNLDNDWEEFQQNHDQIEWQDLLDLWFEFDGEPHDDHDGENPFDDYNDNDLHDLFNDFGGWLSTLNENDQQYDDLYYDPDIIDIDNCYFDPPITGDLTKDRTIFCQWFYVKDCGDISTPNWWDAFDEIIHFEDFAQWRDYEIYKIIVKHELNITSGELDILAVDCDAFSPDFEDCVLRDAPKTT